MSRIELYKGDPCADGDWRWRLVSSNGRVVAQGEGYKRQSGAWAGARAMQRAAQTARWVVRTIK